MQRILVHIGDKKTGSTAIQQALASGAWRCDTVSLDYVVPPDVPYHHGLAYAMAHGSDAEATRLLKDLARRVASSKADVIVISSELFRDVDPVVFEDMFARVLPRHGSRVEILAYMRPHVQRFESNYAQIVKLGIFDGTPEWHFRNTRNGPAYFHAELFLRWKAVFGDRLTVRPMQRSRLHGGDVVRDFFHVALGGAEFSLADLPRINASPSLQELALLRRFHIDLKAVHDGRDSPALASARMRVGERLGEIMGAYMIAQPPIRFRIDRALAEQIAATYGEDAARADAAFFDAPLMQDAMAADVAAAPQDVPSCWAKDHFTQDALQSVSLLARIIGEMLLNDPESWDGYFLSVLNTMLRRACDPLQGA